jgi:hypothetical protein
MPKRRKKHISRYNISPSSMLSMLLIGVLLAIIASFYYVELRDTSKPTPLPTIRDIKKTPVPTIGRRYDGPPRSFKAYTPVTEDERLAYSVLVNFLEANMLDSAYDLHQISRYFIDDIKDVHFVDNELRFRTVFSIVPKTDYSQGPVDNGILTSDGWWRYESGFAVAKKHGDTYTLGGIITGWGGSKF